MKKCIFSVSIKPCQKSSMQKFLRLLLGAPNDDDPPIGHHFEKFISALGALVAIFCVAAINAIAITDLGAPLIIASMGASAVLLFATPHSPFPQPWPVLGGQLVSGMIGVSCATYISDIRLAAALAVGLSLFAMYYLRCLHPPGGATALSAVIGGVTVHQLGFQYVAAPVMLDALVIIFVAVLFNYLFPWRRYPLWLNAPPAAQGPAPAGEPAPLHIAKEDIHYALQHMESFVDVRELDLAEIYRLATHHAGEGQGDLSHSRRRESARHRHLHARRICALGEARGGGDERGMETGELIYLHTHVHATAQGLLYRVASLIARRMHATKIQRGLAASKSPLNAGSVGGFCEVQAGLASQSAIGRHGPN